MSACSAEVDGGGASADRGDVRTIWEPPPPSVETILEVSGVQTSFETAVSMLNAHLGLPRDLEVAHVACGTENAFYDRGEDRIRLCYEFLVSIDTLARDNPTLTEEEVFARIRGTWLFIFFHELGHALIDYYAAPVLGGEEDAVDHLSTLLLLATAGPDVATLAAGYWGARSAMMVAPLDFADAHSLDGQRFFDILCLVYGSAPEAHADLVTSNLLSEARAGECPREYALVRDSWYDVLAPWLK